MFTKMVDLQERLHAMLHQEVCFYKTEDYLAPNFQQQLSAGTETAFFLSSSASNSSYSSSSSSNINEVWREKICEWAYQVIDHFDFSREVVGVAIHYLDRYLATRIVSKKIFQLAAMTSLFLAIKLYEPGRISMTSMIDLSRGYFTLDQMVAMETSILRSVLISCRRQIPSVQDRKAKYFLLFLHPGTVCIDTRSSCFVSRNSPTYYCLFLSLECRSSSSNFPPFTFSRKIPCSFTHVFSYTLWY